MKINNLLWGIVLIIIGIVFGLNALEIANINIFFDGWWTLFIIIPNFIDLFKEKDKTGNIIGLVIGILLFLCCRGLFDFEILFKLFIPFILVVLGLSLIFRDNISKKLKKEMQKINKNDSLDYWATFGSQNLDFSKENFDGCNLTAVFGEIKCDLRDSLIKEDIIITTSAIFGGITIYVPDDINVKVVCTPIFGGVEDERKRKKNDSEITIYINATCIFGGVDIK